MFPRFTREQWKHIVIHSSKAPAAFLVGKFFGASDFAVVLVILYFYVTELGTDLLYWMAINRRPRSGSPDFYEPRLPPRPPDPPRDVPRCAECGHPCPACELRIEYQMRPSTERRRE